MKDVLARVDGVGRNVMVFGARDYAMRVWLDPAKIAARNLTAGEVVAAIRAANVQVAAGAIQQPLPKPTPPSSSPCARKAACRTLTSSAAS